MQRLNKLTRGIVLLSLLAFVGVVGCSDSPSGPTLVILAMEEGPRSPILNLDDGKTSYDTQCQGCHGAMGAGGSSGRALDNYPPGSFYAEFANLQGKIHSSMPRGNSGACEDMCADDVSGYIYCEWNPTLVTSGCR
jgi:mono/diheme cytochrome c family protein